MNVIVRTVYYASIFILYTWQLTEDLHSALHIWKKMKICCNFLHYVWSGRFWTSSFGI